MPTVLHAARFPAGTIPLAGSSSEEGAVIETEGVILASLSGRAWRACPVHLPCAGRESNPDVRRHTLLRRARLPVTPPAH
jgi:hypothetical protein